MSKVEEIPLDDLHLRAISTNENQQGCRRFQPHHLSVSSFLEEHTNLYKMAVDDMVTDPLLKNVLSISAAARDQALTLLDLVDKHALDTERTSSSPSLSDIQHLISKQQKLLYAHLAQLRGAHRDATFSARETKALTAEARQEVDRLHLQLQNLYYEQRHLRGEITACASYE